MFTTAVAVASIAYIAQFEPEDLEASILGPVVVDLFAWYVIGAYLGVSPSV